MTLVWEMSSNYPSFDIIIAGLCLYTIQVHRDIHWAVVCVLGTPRHQQTADKPQRHEQNDLDQASKHCRPHFLRRHNSFGAGLKGQHIEACVCHH